MQKESTRIHAATDDAVLSRFCGSATTYKENHSGRELSGAIAWHRSTNVSLTSEYLRLKSNLLLAKLQNHGKMRQVSSLSVWRTKCVRASPILESWRRQNKGLSSAFALDQLNCPMTIGLEKKELIPRRDFVKMQRKSRDFQNQIYVFILSKPPHESIHPHYRPKSPSYKPSPVVAHAD